MCKISAWRPDPSPFRDRFPSLCLPEVRSDEDPGCHYDREIDGQERLFTRPTVRLTSVVAETARRDIDPSLLNVTQHYCNQTRVVISQSGLYVEDVELCLIDTMFAWDTSSYNFRVGKRTKANL